MTPVAANLAVAGTLVFVNAAWLWVVWPKLTARYRLNVPNGRLAVVWMVLLAGAVTLYLVAPANMYGMGGWGGASASHPPASLPAVGVALFTVGSTLILVDVSVRKLPNVLVGIVAAETGLAIGLAALTLLAAAEFPWVLLGSTALWVVPLRVGNRFGQVGFGDVKLAGVLGMAAGTMSLFVAALALIVTFLTAGIHALVLKTRGAGGRLPLGPHMIAGVMIVWGSITIGSVWL